MLNMFILSVLFLILFTIAELAYHFLQIEAELTRKFVHVGTGILTMLFPIMLESHWQVLVLCASFFLILKGSLRFNQLKSINAIERETKGSTLYPVIVYLVFFIYSWQQVEKMYFYLPVLTMAICDPMAALIGKKYGVKKYHISTDVKSYLGSFAFFCTSVPLTLCAYWSSYQTLDLKSLLLAISIGSVAMLAEAVSSKGFDNFSIPASVMGILFLIL